MDYLFFNFLRSLESLLLLPLHLISTDGISETREIASRICIVRTFHDKFDPKLSKVWQSKT